MIRLRQARMLAAPVRSMFGKQGCLPLQSDQSSASKDACRSSQIKVRQARMLAAPVRSKFGKQGCLPLQSDQSLASKDACRSSQAAASLDCVPAICSWMDFIHSLVLATRSAPSGRFRITFSRLAKASGICHFSRSSAMNGSILQ